MTVKELETSLEKTIKDAFDEGYTTGWANALQMAADLLDRFAKQQKYTNTNRRANERSEDERSD